jgi:CRP-like cAMP-binding protein
VSPRDQKLELLASVRLFGKCGSKEIQRLGELTDVMDFPSGRVLMRQGEFGHEMMIIVDGRVAIEKDGAVIAERGPGEVVGEMALLTDQPRRATVTLLTDGRVLIVGQREFHALMDEMPAVRAQVMEALALALMDAEAKAAA